MRQKAVLALLGLVLAACEPGGGLGAGDANADLAEACSRASGAQRIDACTAMIDLPETSAFNRAGYLVFRGEEHRAMDDPTAALRDFDAAIRLDETHIRAYLGRGEILLESGQLDAARPMFERIVQQDQSGRAALGLARIEWSHGEGAAALTHLQAALERDAGLAEAHALRARIRKSGGDLEGARADFSAAIAANGALAAARAGRCRLNLEANQNLDQARDDGEAAVLADARNVEAQICLGVLRLRAREPEAALSAFAAALAVEPGNPEALFGHGVARMRTGDRAGARDMNRARDFSSHVGQRFEQLGVGTW